MSNTTHGKPTNAELTMLQAYDYFDALLRAKGHAVANQAAKAALEALQAFPMGAQANAPTHVQGQIQAPQASTGGSPMNVASQRDDNHTITSQTPSAELCTHLDVQEALREAGRHRAESLDERINAALRDAHARAVAQRRVLGPDEVEAIRRAIIQEEVPQPQEPTDRSEAARKGWETRRANQRAAEEQQDFGETVRSWL